MIGRLTGKLVVKKPPLLVIDVSGVGYEVEAPMSTVYDLPEMGSSLTLFTHLQVREDAQNLYGFYKESDRALFRDLIKVSGIGAKMALAVLSGMDADEFALAVQSEDVQGLVKIPGIGKKTAERLLMEMRDKIDTATLAGKKRTSRPLPDDPAAEATSALIGLGYKPSEVTKLVLEVSEEGMKTEDIIRLALREAGSR